MSRTARPLPDPAVAVDQWFATLVHPHADGLAQLHSILLGADPAVSTGIKWNVPSFRTVEWFATLHVRSKRGFGLILHPGARKRADLPTQGLALADPQGLLQWLGPDRALVEFADAAALTAQAEPLTRLVRGWLDFVRPL